MTAEVDKTPVSRVLEAEIRTELRRKGCQVVWLDRDGDYEEFVDGLRERWERGDFAYPVMAYRGSFLELIFQLEEFVDQTDHQAVLIHMPGYNEETIRETPVYEHYAAGKRYRKSLATLVEDAAAGKVAPRAIENFTKDEGVTLGAADDWLEEQTREESLLEKLSITELWCRLEGTGGKPLPPEEAQFDRVLEHLEVRVGLTEDWRHFSQFSKGSDETAGLSPLADELAGWAMVVEYVDDLRRDPVMEKLKPLGELPVQIRAECRKLTRFMRTTSGMKAIYVRIADELGERLREEFESGVVDDLGAIDTFRFEEIRFLRGALNAIGKEQWEVALERTAHRASGRSFWVERDPKRGHAWSLVRSAAKLGKAIAEHHSLLTGAQSLPEAVQSYGDGGWRVDQAHRRLEQLRAALLEPGLPDFVMLRSHLDDMRRLYRQWADEVAVQFNDLCEKVGFVPTESLQQRYLFEQVVEPWTQGNEKTALFMVDALRYEMAEELREDLVDTGMSAHLDRRLAELPTITAVGMNVLAPVTDSSGRLRPVVKGEKFKGFATSVFQVRSRKTRKKMMRHCVEGRTCPLMDISVVLQKERLGRVVQEASLVLVHSKGIDEVGEQGYGQLTFETTLRDIRSAVHILREAGVQRFVITADHGFLLLDSTTRKKKRHGKKTDPNHRWRLYEGMIDDPDVVGTALTSLGYADVDQTLLMPRDTAIFDTGELDKTFVHGGNSLQERLIPVLRLEYRREVGGSTTEYQIVARVGESIMDMHCLELTVSPQQGMLDLGGPREVELSLRTPKGVTAELCSARGGAKLRGTASVVVPVEQTVEVFFKLKAEFDRRASVDIYAPTQADVVRLKKVDAQFDVVGIGVVDDDDDGEVQQDAQSLDAPLDAIDDEDVRRVFAHILEYGSIDEQGATKLIGSARKFRSFSVRFEDYVELLPVVVEIQWSREKNMKEYVLIRG